MNLKYFISACTCTLLIIYASSIPDFTVPAISARADQVLSNLAHIPAYALITFLWLNSFTAPKRSAVLALVIISAMVMFAISDELHQSMVPGRTASILDICLDLIGVIIGYFTFKFTRKLELA